ncbi:hypothetical protein D3C80_1904900 [compost metagenome]
MNSKITAAATIELYNVTGAVVLKQDRKITSGKNEFEIDMQQLPAGVYTTAIHINGQTLHTKIIKQ